MAQCAETTRWEIHGPVSRRCLNKAGHGSTICTMHQTLRKRVAVRVEDAKACAVAPAAPCVLCGDPADYLLHRTDRGVRVSVCRQCARMAKNTITAELLRG